MADFGYDLNGTADLDPGFSFVTGPRALAQAIVRRLSTPRGGLPYDADYGTDVRDMVEQGQTPQTIATWQSAIAAECLKDERVASASATVALNTATQTATVVVEHTTAEGPFRLTVLVSALTVELLDA